MSRPKTKSKTGRDRRSEFDQARPKALYAKGLKVKPLKRMKDCFAFSFNPKNPDVGSFVAAIYAWGLDQFSESPIWQDPQG